MAPVRRARWRSRVTCPSSRRSKSCRTLLDGPENRFPLTFNSDLPRIRELFHAATRNQWDPQDRYRVGQVRSRSVHAGERTARGSTGAAALGGIRRDLGKPGVAIAFRRREASFRHAAVLHHPVAGRSASRRGLPRDGGKLGGYIDKPVQQLFQGSVATHGVRRATCERRRCRSRGSSPRSSARPKIAFDVFKHLDDVTATRRAADRPSRHARQIAPLRLRLVLPRGDLQISFARSRRR